MQNEDEANFFDFEDQENLIRHGESIYQRPPEKPKNPQDSDWDPQS